MDDGIHLQDTWKSLLGQNLGKQIFMQKWFFFNGSSLSRRPYDRFKNFN